VLEEPAAAIFKVEEAYIYTTTERRIPEETLLHSNQRENLKSHKLLIAALRNNEAKQFHLNAIIH
jgi:hypothetical protein